jgi:alcohol dehydrogenase class IV
MLLNSLSFTMQIPKNIVFGEAATKQISPIAKQLEAKSALLITDKTIKGVGLSKSVLTYLTEAGIRTEIFDDVEPEPSIETAERVARTARGCGCDLIVGLGGGSCLDMAKVASICVTNDQPLRDFVGVERVQHAGVPKILLPTTSGTGSEVTMNAIVSNGEEELKAGIVSRHNLADAAIVDPLLTLSVPPRVTAFTGLDALTHAIESIMSNGSNPFSASLAKEATRLIFKWLPKACREGESVPARSAMSLASLFAGIALEVSGVCVGHAAAYSFAVRHKVPHGTACAIALPYTIEFNSQACLPRIVSVAGAAGLSGTGAIPEEAAFNLVRSTRELIEEVGNPISLKEIGLKETEIQEVARKMLGNQRLMGKNPRTFTEPEAEEFVRRMYLGEALPLSAYSKN